MGGWFLAEWSLGSLVVYENLRGWDLGLEDGAYAPGNGTYGPPMKGGYARGTT